MLEEATARDRERNERKKIGAPFNAANAQIYAVRAGALIIRHFYSTSDFNDLSKYVSLTAQLNCYLGASENECNGAMVFALSRTNGMIFF